MMTNEELNTAIDTAAKHAVETYGSYERGATMLKHLKELLALQLARAREDTPA